jgi:hypothetical protein
MRAFVVVELERARERVEDRVAGVRALTLFEPGVVGGAHARQLRELFAAQPRDATRAVGGDPRGRGCEPRPTAAQELAKGSAGNRT